MKKLSLLLLLTATLSITQDTTAGWFSSSYRYKTVYRDARGNKQACSDLLEKTNVPFDPTQAGKYFDAFQRCATKYPNTAEKHMYANRDKLDVIAVIAALKARDFQFSDDFNRKMIEGNKAYGFMAIVEYLGKAIEAINNNDNDDDNK